jgi:hypothetical protein
MDGLVVDGDGTLQTLDGAILKLRTTDTSALANDIAGAIYFETDDPSRTQGTRNSIESILLGGQANTRLKFKSSQDDGALLTRMDIDSNGDISFYEDTGTTAKLFWDASAESLGIGTSSPDAKLRITGGYENLFIAAGTNGVLTVSNPSENLVTIFSGTSDALALGTSSTERMRIEADGEIRTSNAVIVGRLATRQTQAVGITDATLVLAGNSNVSGVGEEIGKVAFYNQDASGAGHNLAATVKALTNSAIGANANLVFSTKQGVGEGAEALESMRIDSAGNVGIGTDSPATKLEVEGNSGAATGTVSAPVAIRITDTSDIGAGGDTTNPYAALQFFSRDLSNEGPIVQAQIGTIYDDEFGAGSNLTFSTWNGGLASPAERMRIDSAGNVGIGTADADSKLKVELNPSGTVLAGLRVGYNNTSVNYLDADINIFRTGNGVSERYAHRQRR